MIFRLSAVILAVSAFTASAKGINYDVLRQMHNDPVKPFATYFLTESDLGKSELELYDSQVDRSFCSGGRAVMIRRSPDSMKVLGIACWNYTGYDSDGLVVRVDYVFTNSDAHHWQELRQRDISLVAGAHWPTF